MPISSPAPLPHLVTLRTFVYDLDVRMSTVKYWHQDRTCPDRRSEDVLRRVDVINMCVRLVRHKPVGFGETEWRVSSSHIFIANPTVHHYR